MDKHYTGGLYLNFPGFGEEKEELVRAGYGANYERLARLKAEYDPDNLVRMDLNIRAGAEAECARETLCGRHQTIRRAAWAWGAAAGPPARGRPVATDPPSTFLPVE